MPSSNPEMAKQDPDRYTCEKCGKLLFRGNLRLMLTKAMQPKECLEHKCSRCGHLNYFVPEPMVLK